MLSVMTNPGRCLMGRLAKGDDLLQALERLCQEHNITLGEVRALGAVTRAKVGFYDQAQKKYSFLAGSEKMITRPGYGRERGVYVNRAKGRFWPSRYTEGW